MNRRARKAIAKVARQNAPGQKIENASTPFVKPTKEQITDAILGSRNLNSGLSGLNEALFPAGMGFNPNVAFGQQQVSNTNTLYSNLRGYMVSNMRQLLSQSYVELGLIQAVVDIPVDDGFRGGVDITSEQLKEEQLKELKATMSREGDVLILKEGMKWTRLFGGGGIVILVDQDPEQPLDVSQLNRDTPLEFKAADLWELFYDKMNLEGFNPAIDAVAFNYYSYYGHKTHRSRVMKLKGLTAPSFVRPRLRGWGFSVVEGLIRSINQNLKGVDLIFELLDEAKIDIFQFKNLADTLLMQNGAQAVQQRVAIANRQKNFQTALVLDSEDVYNQKELAFAGIADMMKEIRIQVACDMRMPMVKLFGIGAVGMNASSEDEIEVYNGMVESTVREKAKYDVIRMAQLRSQQLFGFIPTDLEANFQPLRVMSSEQEAGIKTQTFARVIQAVTAGLISGLEFRNSVNKDNLLPIKLDITGFEIDSDEATSIPEDVTSGTTPAFGGDDVTGDTDGANRSDSEKETPVINKAS